MKNIFLKIHLWLSLPFGLVIAIVCLTGSVMVFEAEILELCYPSRYFVEEARGKALPPAELISAARKQLPDLVQISGLRVLSDPSRTYQLLLPGKRAVCFVNPYTAQITGIDNGQGFFTQTMRLHRWLLGEYKRDGSFSAGKAAVGYSTLAFVAILLSGLVAWLPRSRKMLANRLKIKTHLGWRRFLYDLHVSGGFYTALLLLVLAITGLTWSFDWSRNALYAAFGIPPTRTEVHTSSSPSATPKAQPDYTPWTNLLSDLQSRHPDYRSITIQPGSATVSTAAYGNMRAADRYTFHPSTGCITGAKLYADLPNSAKIRGWIYSVHVGSWGGLTTRLLTCLVSLLGALFALSGYYFWLKKRRRC